MGPHATRHLACIASPQALEMWGEQRRRVRGRSTSTLAQLAPPFGKALVRSIRTGAPTPYPPPLLHPPDMSLLQLAHADRQANRPRVASSCYAGPVDTTYGRLPGWVADITRTNYPTYARGR